MFTTILITERVYTELQGKNLFSSIPNFKGNKDNFLIPNLKGKKVFCVIPNFKGKLPPCKVLNGILAVPRLITNYLTFYPKTTQNSTFTDLYNTHNILTSLDTYISEDKKYSTNAKRHRNLLFIIRRIAPNLKGNILDLTENYAKIIFTHVSQNIFILRIYRT